MNVKKRKTNIKSLLETAIIRQNIKEINHHFLKYQSKVLKNENIYTLLHLAAEFASSCIIKLILRKGIPIDEKSSDGKSALQVAICAGRHRIVKLLLEHNASISTKDNSGKTPLHWAVEKCQYAMYRRSFSRRRIVNLLLRRGADVNSSTVYGETVFRHAIEKGNEHLVRLLIKYGADVNARDRNNETPIYYAVQRSNRSMARLLLDAGACVHSRNKDGLTSLHLAASRARDEHMVRLLLDRGALITSSDNSGKTPIHMAARILYYDNEDIVKRRQSIVKMLLEEGADANHVSTNGEPAFYSAIGSDSQEMVKLFLQYGAACDVKNSYGETPLHIAVEYASEEITKMLLNKGAILNAKTKKGVTPLHNAVQFRKEKHIQLLLTHGADINCIDADGQSPLHYAACLNYLDKKTMQRIINYLLEMGADYYIKSIDGKTSLDTAIEKTNTAMVKVLLKYIAMMNAAGDPNTNEVLQSIKNCTNWKNLYEKYQSELQRMKTEMVSNNISFYKLMTKSSNEIAIYSRNGNFEKEFLASQGAQHYPTFWQILKERFNEGSRRKNLLDDALMILYSIFQPYGLPYLVIMQIIQYYSTNDLERLVK